MPGSFFDTNVLLYIASGDPAKADRAERIIADGGTISVQVLNYGASALYSNYGASALYSL
jgi:predicted nucleic acid-binding protein